MRVGHLKTYVVGSLVALALWTGCDTTNNFESPLEKYFVKYIGKDGSQSGVDMVVALDRSVYVLGNTTSPVGQQLYLARMSAAGMEDWARILGTGVPEEAKDVEMLADSTLAILSMAADGTSGNRDFVIRIVSRDNVLLDSITYGSPNFNEEAISITQTSDLGFIVSGYTDDVDSLATSPADFMFFRFNQDLTLYPNWEPKYGAGIDFDVAVKTMQVGSEFYVFGYSNRLDGFDAVPDFNVTVFVLGNSSGGVPSNDFTTSNRLFRPDSLSIFDERLTSVSVIPPQSGSGFLLTGYSVDPALNEQRIFAMKIRRDLANIPPTHPVTNANNVGAILAADPPSDLSPVSSISTSPASGSPSQREGFFLLAEVGADIYLKKLNTDLSDEWSLPDSFIFGGFGSDLAGAVLESPDGRILVLGTIVIGEVTDQTKMVLIKLSPNGKLGE